MVKIYKLEVYNHFLDTHNCVYDPVIYDTVLPKYDTIFIYLVCENGTEAVAKGIFLTNRKHASIWGMLDETDIKE